jgi:hypothetical protein
MYLRSEKYVIEEFVKVLRRIFRYNNNWVNLDYEIIQISSGSALSVFEQYNEENEKYPVITIGGLGYNSTNPSFNNLINVYDNDSIEIGERKLQYEEISHDYPVSFELPSTVTDETLRGIMTSLAWSSLGTGGDTIGVEVYKNFTSTPVLVASGSFEASTSTGFNDFYAELCPYVLLDSSDYWVTLTPPTGSSYYVAVDSTTSERYRYGGTYYSGSVSSKVIFKPFVRAGGNLEGSISIKCSTKNDTKLLANLKSLITIYIQLLKHSEISRDTNNVNTTLNSHATKDVVNEWLKKGIFIKAVRVGGQEVRRRTDNDVIFSSPIVVDYLTEWFVDYDVDAIEGFNLSVITQNN